MSKSKVYSVHAQEAVSKHIKEIDQLMSLISTEMGKYKSLQRVHYGYAGDLAHVEEQLVQIWEFISEADD